MTDERTSTVTRQRSLSILLIVWITLVLILYWIAEGSPGVPAIAELTEPLGDLLRQFFSAPYQG
jgi:hypothetical protein